MNILNAPKRPKSSPKGRRQAPFPTAKRTLPARPYGQKEPRILKVCVKPKKAPLRSKCVSLIFLQIQQNCVALEIVLGKIPIVKGPRSVLSELVCSKSKAAGK